jgi:hypothetical protein
MGVFATPSSLVMMMCIEQGLLECSRNRYQPSRAAKCFWSLRLRMPKLVQRVGLIAPGVLLRLLSAHNDDTKLAAYCCTLIMPSKIAECPFAPLTGE